MNLLAKNILKSSFILPIHKVTLRSFTVFKKPQSPELPESLQNKSRDQNKGRKKHESSESNENKSTDKQRPNNGFNKGNKPFIRKVKFSPVEESSMQIDNKLLQTNIKKAKTLEAVLGLYDEYKLKMDLVNICTCLDQAVGFSVQRFNNLDLKHPLTQNERVLEIIDFLANHVDQMSEFTLSNFFTNLTKLGITDRQLLERIIQKILANRHLFNLKALSFILWSFAKIDFKNQDFMNLVTDKLISQGDSYKAVSLISVFWSLGKLGCDRPEIDSLLRRFIVKYYDSFSDLEYCLIFATCGSFKLTDPAILDMLAEAANKNVTNKQTRWMANILDSCANLDYVPEGLIGAIKMELTILLKNAIKKRKEQEIGEEEKKTLGEKSKGPGKWEINLLDLVEGYAALSRLGILDTELIELVQEYYILELEEIPTGVLFSYFLANINVTSKLGPEFKRKNEIFFKRVQDSNKHKVFRDVIRDIQNLKEEEIGSKEILYILTHAPEPASTPKTLKQAIVGFGIAQIPKLTKAKDNLSETEYEKLMHRYYLVLQKYITRSDQLMETTDAFKKIDVDIESIHKKHTEKEAKSCA